VEIFRPIGARYLSSGQKYSPGGAIGAYRLMLYLYIFGKLSSRQCYVPFDAAAYRLWDIRGQNLGLGGPLGVRPQRGDFVSEIDIYHDAKYHADRCHRRRDICNQTDRHVHTITADLISDTSVAFVDIILV